MKYYLFTDIVKSNEWASTDILLGRAATSVGTDFIEDYSHRKFILKLDEEEALILKIKLSSNVKLRELTEDEVFRYKTLGYIRK